VADDEERGSLHEGDTVGGRFKVERLIGRGGMGEVYAARHATTGKEVALKLILAAGSGKEHVRRFMREARAATAIQHPNVIEVFDVFEDAEGTPVMVMELLKGEPFSALLERARALDLQQTAEVLLPAARALQAAHAKGIVHRDLKPDNVFLATTPAGRSTKLLDFGIAKILDPTKLSSETQGQHTSTGSILGTPHYMSFEQAMSDKNVDHRTDIWAMGVMLFESLTGRRPMTYETLGQMYASFLQGSVPSIREFVPDLPDDMASVLDKCLAKKPEDRLADLGPLVEVLAKYTDPSVPGARAGGRVVEAPVVAAREVTAGPLSSSVSDTRPRRASRARATWIAGGLALVALGGVGVVAIARKPVGVREDGARTGGPAVSSAPVTIAPPGASGVTGDASADAGAGAGAGVGADADAGAGVGPGVGAGPGVGVDAGAPKSPRPGHPATVANPPAAQPAPAPASSPSHRGGIGEKLPY
jgi:hypothetical protein